MSRVWICLSLLCAATHSLQSNAPPAVNMRCNETVEVEAGKPLTVYCTVNYIDQPVCRITQAQLNTNSNVTYDYEIKSNTSVLLNVSNVTKDNNWTVEVETDCGSTNLVHVKVTVNLSIAWTEPKKSVQPSDWHTTAPIIFCVCLFLTAGILYFLFGTDRGRKIIKREKIQGQTQTHHCRLANAEMYI